MEMLLEQAIKNLKYMCNHSNLEHDRKSLRTVIKFVESYENRLKADLIDILEDLRLDFQEAELAGVFDNKELIFADEVDDLVQQKINSLKEGKDGLHT